MTEAEWRSRHRFVGAILVVHMLLLPLYAVLRHAASWQAVAGIATMAVLAGAAALPVPRRLRTVSAALALVTASCALVVMADGASYAMFDVLLAVTAIALYEDWPTYLSAVGCVVLQPVLAVTMTRASLLDGGTPTWWPALIQGVLVLLTCAAQIMFWHYLEQGRRRARQAHDELSNGQESLREQMNELATTREQLVATVSHEFRTPLTAIRGSALTLRRRRDRLDAKRTDELLEGILANTDRLSRLLENMLAAAEVPHSDGWDVTDVFEVANEVAMVVHGRHAAASDRGAERPQPIAVAVPRRLNARINRDALHQVLANLVDNAVIHAAPGSQALLTGVPDGSSVVITVANEADGIDATTLAGLFEPFTLADASDTRERAGAGVGLYVVRRLVDAARGSVSVRSEPGWVSVEVRLPAGAEPVRRTRLVDLTPRAETAAPPATA
ncbi:MAG: integral rane sensor signal transduction histidine kinase [Frankiales bacterium]|nr:integral rane sensor signal transduction histidine kinase [Frankiales bacterium]